MVLAISMLSQRSRSGVRTFVAIMLAVSFWCLFGALESSVNELQSKVIFTQLQYLAIAILPPLWLIFVLRYTQQNSFFKLPTLLFLWIIPLVTIGLAFTNSLHGLMWENARLTPGQFGNNLAFDFGIWHYFFIGFAYLINFLGIIALFWAIIRYPYVFSQQAWALSLGIALPWIAEILNFRGSPQFLGFDITPVAFFVSGLVISWAVFRLHLFDMVPVAREAILDNLSGAVIVLDSKNRVADINQPALRLFNFDTPENAIGKDVAILWANWPKIVEAFISKPMEQQEIRLNDTTYIEVRNTPITDTLGRYSLRLIELNDISQRKRSEERNQLQSYALEAAANSVMITDREGKIFWVNSALTETSGYTKEELIGQTPSILNSGVHPPSYFKNMWDTLLAGRSWRGETVNKRKDGTLYTEEQTIAPILDEQRKVIYFIAVKQDVSDRKALEKLRDDLVYTIVHDLRNPLTSISMSLDVIERGIKKHGSLPEDQMDMLDIARSNTRRMASLVNSILDINRLENERMPVNLVAISLHKLVTDAMKFQVALAKAKGLMLQNEIPEDLPLVAVDIGLIGRVLQNLIDNAIKFTPSGGEIRVVACPDQQPGLYRVCVKDSGPGIPEDVQSRLFQKFASGSEPGHGTGLGLAYCRLAIETHGGRIWVESDMGSGTTFYFTLPGAAMFKEFSSQ
jgi:PAS domain S-box-containing protein